MAGDYLKYVAGFYQEIVALVTSTGATDAGKIVKTDATGRLDSTIMPLGVGVEAISVIASEALSANDLVSTHNVAGVLNIRKADGSSPGKPADGFVLAAVAQGASGTYWPEEGRISGLTGLTPGQDVFLSVTAPGALTTTVPTGAGKIGQYVGRTLSPTEVMFRRGMPTLMA